MKRNQPDRRVTHLGPSKPAPGREAPDEHETLEHYRRLHERIRRDDDDDTQQGATTCPTR